MTIGLLDPEVDTAIAEPQDAKWMPQQYFDPDFVREVSRQIEALGELRAGWDGYRAHPVSPQIIESAVALIRRLPAHIAPRPRVVPLASGAVQFEWTRGATALELEFESPETIHYLKWHPDSNVSEEDTFSAVDVTRIESLIQWFVRRNG